MAYEVRIMDWISDVCSSDLVEDPDMRRETFDRPGRVIKRPRGTMAEHMAALPKTRASPRAKRKPDMGQEDAPHAGKGGGAAKPEALPDKPKPRPNDAPVQRAEAALADAEERHAEERSENGRAACRERVCQYV